MILPCAKAYVAGVVAGDGWCTDKSFGLHCKDRDFADAFVSAVQQASGTLLNLRDDQGYWRATRSNRDGRFNEIGLYRPASESELCYWLRGLFDSDGNAQLWHMPHVSPGAYHRRVAIFKTDLNVLETASDYMATLGIRHTIRSTKNSPSHMGTKTVYGLFVQRRDGFTAFRDKVGSSIARKADTLDLIVTTYQPNTDYCRRAQTLGVAARKRRKST